MSNKDTRKKLIRVARDLFHHKGYSETSIRDIGSRAGISSSIIYHYFKNKEDILLEVISNAEQELIDQLKLIGENVQDPLECLKEMLLEHIVSFGHKKESKIIVVDYFGLRGKRAKMSKKKQREIYSIYMKKLKELKEAGLLKDIDLKVIAFSIFGIINWFYRWHKEKGQLSKEDVAKAIMSMLFHGILKEKK